MSDGKRDLDALPAGLVRESRMPAYHYQQAPRGTGSVSPRSDADLQARIEALRSLNLTLAR
jgi:hypothetical protein